MIRKNIEIIVVNIVQSELLMQDQLREIDHQIESVVFLPQNYAVIFGIKI